MFCKPGTGGPQPGRWNTLLPLCLILSAGPIPLTAEAEGFPVLNYDPHKAGVIVEDVHNFWKAWDLAAASPEERREIFQREYLDAGTPGLQSFINLRIDNVDRLLNAIDAAPRYYASLRESSKGLDTLKPQLRQAFRRLQEMFPEAVFPDTYLVMGALNSGGTIDLSGVLIGFEMNARGPDSPLDELSEWHRRVIGTIDALPVIIVHEWVHIQQAVYGRLDFTDLLGRSIIEGAADFIAELAMGSHTNTSVHDWATPREAMLWGEFQEVMHGEDTSGWLYGGTGDTDRPADLGYFIGYRIVEAYYQQAEDPAAALREIISMTDPEDFLHRSGYTGQTPVLAPEA